MNQLLNKSFETLVIRGVSQAFTIVTSVVLARVLGPYGKGVMTYAATVALLLLTAWSGQSAAIAWQYGRLKVPSGVVAQAAIRILAVLGLPVVLCLIIIGFTAPDQHALIAAGAALPFYLFSNTALGFFLADGNVRVGNIQTVITQVAFCIAVAVVLLIAHGGLTAALVTWVLSISASAAYTGFKLRPYVARGVHAGVRDLIPAQVRFSAQASVGALARMLNSRIEVFIIMFFLGLQSLGVYSVALGLGELMWQLPDALLTSAFGRITTQSKAEAAELTAKCTRHAFLIVFVLGALVFVFGPELIRLVYGPAFTAAGPVVRVLLPGLMAYGTMSFLGTFFVQQLGMPNIPALINALSVIICATVTVATIPSLGIVGGALGTTVSYLIATLAAGLFFTRATGLPLRRLYVLNIDDWREYRALFAAITGGTRSRSQEAHE
jgi:O-antigen/teichoic acid export membrane protein